MSLTDAMLLDPHRDVRDVWFARRIDGASGSGTADDPWDGGVRIDPPKSISSLVQESTGSLTAVAQISGNHGYFDGDMVVISGVTGTAGDFYNGTFVIHSITDSQFKYTMPGNPGGAAPGSNKAAARLVHQLDERLHALASQNVQGVCVRFGPGTFETRGNALAIKADGDVVPWIGWQPRDGWNISGSGMGVTVLKVVGAKDPRLLVSAIGSQNFGETSYGVTVSDLTVDCNMGANRGMAVGAVALVGGHQRVRRVRAIHFGSETPMVECFVIAVANAHPNFHELREVKDCVIEDCIVEHPWLNNARETSCLHTGGGERPTDGVHAYHRGCVIRDCYVNCELVDQPLDIASISFNAGTGFATVTTRVPHGRVNGNYVVISGALVQSSGVWVLDNAYNGTYDISNVSVDGLQFDYEPRDVAGHVPTSNPTGAMWIGRSPSHRVPVLGISKAGNDDNATLAILTTPYPHNRKIGQFVLVIEAGATTANHQPYLGHFPIEDTPSAYELHYRMKSEPTVDSIAGSIFINPSFQALSADAGKAAVTERNRIFGTAVGGSYHDTYSTGDITNRDNYISDATNGPFQNLGGTSALKLGSSLVNGRLATFTTLAAHGLSAGDPVTIKGAVVNGSYDNPYNGVFEVLEAPPPTSTEFSYLMLANPRANAQGSPVFGTVMDGSVARMIHGTFGPVAVFTTPAAHGFNVNDQISVFGAVVNGSILNPFNGVITVVEKTSTTFTYQLIPDPQTDPTSSASCARKVASELIRRTDVATLATQAAHGLDPLEEIIVRGALAPGVNGIPTYANPYNGKFELPEGTDPNSNAFSYALTELPINDLDDSPYHADGSPVFGDVKTGSSLFRKGLTGADAKIGVFNTVLPHGLEVGQTVIIKAAILSGSVDNHYNRTYTVLEIPNPTSFTYQIKDNGGTPVDPGADASGSPVYSTEQNGSLTRDGKVATFETADPTGLFVGQIVKVSGAIVGGSSDNPYNGVFRVVSVSADPPAFTYVMQSEPSGANTGTPQFTVFHAITSIIRNDPTNPNGKYALVTTAESHRLAVGDAVSIWEAILNHPFGNPFNGAFRVEGLVNTTQFLVTLDFDPGGNPSGATIQWASQNSTPLRRVTDAQGNVLSDPVGNIICEFNTDKPAQSGTVFDEGDLVSMFGAAANGSFVNGFNAVLGVEASPTTRSFRFKILKIFGGDPGINPVAGPVCALAKATPLSVNATTAIFHTVHKHGLVTGQGVKIEDPVEDPLSPFKGFIAVASVLSPTAFRWAYGSSPGGNSPPGYRFSALWQVGQFVAENNVIEMTQARHPDTTFGPSLASALTSNDFRPQYSFRRVLVRENLVRLVPGIPNPYALALNLRDGEQAIIEQNLLDLENAFPLQQLRSQTVHYFNNQNLQGALVQGFDSGMFQTLDELATRVEDAMILSL